MTESRDDDPSQPVGSLADPLGTPLARAVFESATEGLLVLAAGGEVLAVNGAFCALYGIEAGAVVGRHHSSFTDDLQVRRLGGDIGPESWVTLRALRGERVRGVMQAIRNRRTGVEFYARCGATPFHENGRLVSTTIAVVDVTEMTLAQQTVQGALSAAEVGTYRVDLVTKRVWGDENFALLHGLGEGGADGAPLARLYEMMHPDDVGQVTKIVGEATRTGEPHEVEYRIVLPPGERWLLSRGRVELDEHGRPVQRLGSVVDVTARKATEEALRRTQEWLGLAMKAGRMGWWRRDYVTGRIVWSPELQAIFGLDEGTFDGARQSFLDFIHPDDREVLNAAVAEALAERRDYAVEFRFQRTDGTEGWMEGRGRPYFDAAGRPLTSYGIGVDVTDRKAAEEALRRSGATFESLVQNSPLGVYAVDADFRLVLVSRGAQRVFENVRPLLGRDFSEVLRIVWAEPFASEAIRRFRHTLDTGEPFHAPSTVERRLDLGEMESYDWKIERIAMPDGRLGVVCHFYDLSERQRYEAELARRVEERTEELTRANRDLNEFAYSVAHDLRSPLRAIVSTSRILLEDAAPRLTEGERATLERQAKGAVRLAKIVDDLLGFARLANAELRRVDCDLTRIARAAAEEATRRQPAVCDVAVQDGMRADGDPSLLGYALVNLLDNACKFSPQGGRVEVGESGGAFFVRDEGVGFDMAHADKLFVAFERLVDQETFPGTGVGLANVKRIVERHGGRVWAESEPGKGATFWFTLG